MGFSLSAASAIIGISILIAIEILTGSLLPLYTDIIESYSDMKDRAINQIQSDISIISVSTPSNGTNYDLNVTIENTGSITLETSYFNVLINGTDHQFTSSESYLYSKNEVYFNVNNLSGNGRKKLKIVTDNGISDHYEYTIV